LKSYFFPDSIVLEWSQSEEIFLQISNFSGGDDKQTDRQRNKQERKTFSKEKLKLTICQKCVF
jgi:hypothetical protein